MVFVERREGSQTRIKKEQFASSAGSSCVMIIHDKTWTGVIHCYSESSLANMPRRRGVKRRNVCMDQCELSEGLTCRNDPAPAEASDAPWCEFSIPFNTAELIYIL